MGDKDTDSPRVGYIQSSFLRLKLASSSCVCRAEGTSGPDWALMLQDRTSAMVHSVQVSNPAAGAQPAVGIGTI